MTTDIIYNYRTLSARLLLTCYTSVHPVSIGIWDECADCWHPHTHLGPIGGCSRSIPGDYVKNIQACLSFSHRFVNWTKHNTNDWDKVKTKQDHGVTQRCIEQLFKWLQVWDMLQKHCSVVCAYWWEKRRGQWQWQWLVFLQKLEWVNFKALCFCATLLVTSTWFVNKLKNEKAPENSLPCT